MLLFNFHIFIIVQQKHSRNSEHAIEVIAYFAFYT